MQKHALTHLLPCVFCLPLLSLLSATFLFMILLCCIHCCCCGKPKYQGSRVQPLHPIWPWDSEQSPVNTTSPQPVISSWMRNAPLQDCRVLGDSFQRDSSCEGWGHYLHDISCIWYTGRFASREPCCWIPCKSAERHMSSRSITEPDNEALCWQPLQKTKTSQWSEQTKKKADLCLNATVVLSLQINWLLCCWYSWRMGKRVMKMYRHSYLCSSTLVTCFEQKLVGVEKKSALSWLSEGKFIFCANGKNKCCSLFDIQLKYTHFIL